MKRMTLSLAMLLFVLVVPLSLPAGDQAPGAGPEQTAGEKETYEKGMKERLGKLGAQLDELKKKADARAEQVEARMKENLADAETKRQVAARKLEELGRASKESWQKFTAEVEKATKDFEQAFERALRRKE